MMQADLPSNEQLRLKALYDLAILDSPREQSFDDVVYVAMQVCQVPIAVISLIDTHRQWFKSCLGLDVTETPRDVAFCAHAILVPDQVLIVEDATQDVRFFDNPLVTGAPHIRFYAGAPLVTLEGITLGTLCVIDNKPRRLSAEQIAALQALARQVIQLLRLRSAHDRLQHSEQQLSSLLSNFPGAAYRCESNTARTMHYLSDAVHQLTGYSAQVFMQDKTRIFTDLLHPQDVVRRRELVSSALQEKVSFELEYPIQRADGEWRYVHETGRGVFTPQGDLAFIDGFIWDIQRRIDSENERLLSSTKLAQLFETAPIGILQINEQGELLEANPEFSLMLGYSAAELKGMTFLALTPTTDRTKGHAVMTELSGSGRFGPLEKHYRHQSGELIPVEVSGARINSGAHGNSCWWMLVKDIRLQKRMERMKSEFISTVSHELRTPLTSISGALGLIVSNVLGPLPDRAKSMLDIAYKNSQRLSMLINDLLDMEKLLAGKMALEISAQKVLPLVQQTLSENAGYADKYSVHFVLQDQAVGVMIAVDGFRFQQVLANFLSNAAKYSPPGADVIITLALQGEWLRLSVQDYGPGIGDEFKSRIFQKFSQADSSDSRQKGGTGLGLAISKELVERMGGRIGFDSCVGQGSCFFAEFKALHAS